MAGYNNKSKKKKTKGLTIFAVVFVLLFIAAAGLGAWGWVRAFTFEKQLKQEFASSINAESQVLDNGFAVSGELSTPSVMALSVSAMSSVSEADDVVSAEQGYIFEAVIDPTVSMVEDFTYTAKWRESESEWASGKDVTDYVSITVDPTTRRKAKVQPKEPFGEPIIISCTYDLDETKSASRQLDFVKAITNVSVTEVDGEYFGYNSTFANACYVCVTPEYGVGTVKGTFQAQKLWAEFSQSAFQYLENNSYYSTWLGKIGGHASFVMSAKRYPYFDNDHEDNLCIEVTDFLSFDEGYSYNDVKDYDDYLHAALIELANNTTDQIRACTNYLYSYKGVTIISDETAYSEYSSIGTDGLHSNLFDVNHVEWANDPDWPVVFY